MKILGILNITTDSFSDGCRFVETEAARAHGAHLLQDADILDIGGASSNPDSHPVPSETEIARLAAVLPSFRAAGASLSIDSFSSPVQRWALAQDVDYINDIHGFAEPEFYPELAAARAKLIVMHAVLENGIATRDPVAPAIIFDRILDFFRDRIAALLAAGIARERLIVDPGMGFFLGADPETSLTMLRRLSALKAAFGLPLLVSVSRKSFLRRVVAGQGHAYGQRRAPAESGAASLAAELFAAAQGADYIRTHDPAALRDALAVQAALALK